MLSLGILMPFFFLISQILGAVPAPRRSAGTSPTRPGSKIMQVVPDAMDDDKAPYGPWGGLGIMVLWVVAALIGGYVRAEEAGRVRRGVRRCSRPLPWRPGTANDLAGTVSARISS